MQHEKRKVRSGRTLKIKICLASTLNIQEKSEHSRPWSQDRRVTLSCVPVFVGCLVARHLGMPLSYFLFAFASLTLALQLAFRGT